MLTLLFMFSNVFALDPYTNLTEPEQILEFFDTLPEISVPQNTELLGKGTYGEVYRLNETQVVKVIPVLQGLSYLGLEKAILAIKWDINRNRRLNSIYLEILTNLTLRFRLRHNLANFKLYQEIGFNPKTKELLLISEDLELTLETLLSPFKPKKSSTLEFVNSNLNPIYGLIGTVCHRIVEMHEGGYTHFDVRDANIMFHKDGHLVLIDVGCSQPLSATQTKLVSAVNFKLLGYEYFVDKPIVTHGTDMWALGLFILQTCTFEHSAYTLYSKVFLQEMEFKDEQDEIAYILFNTDFQQNIKTLYLDSCGRLVEKIPVELFMRLFDKEAFKRPTGKEFLRSLGNFEEFRSDTLLYSSE